LTTDTYGTNEKTKLFKEGEELVIVPLDPAVIAQRLQTLYDDPHALHALKTNGYRRFNQLFGAEQQLKRRTEIIFHDRLRGELHSLLAQIPSDFGGGATKEKADALLTLALDQQLKTVVEIGVYRGRSLLALALAMTATGGRWLGIDAYCRLVATQQDLVKEKCIRVPGGLEVANQQWLVTTDFEGLSRQVQQLLARVAGEYGRLLRMPTSEAVAILQAEDYVIDLLHIDGNHDTTEVLRDISHYLPLVRSGGYVVMNATNFSSVQRALPALTTVQCVRLQDHGLWQLWRKP
jgi:predicted O-methyltransferase YrrM